MSVDNVEAGRLAAAHLIARGHQRIAFATASGRTMSRGEKIRGFMAAAQAAGLQASASVIDASAASEYGDSEMPDVGRLLAARIAAERLPPTGIVAMNDMLAFGLMAGLREAGIAVPRDISVIGIDGLFLSALMSPSLATVRLPVPEMAATIVERLIGRMANAQLPPGEFLFNPALIEGESVAAPPKKGSVRR